MENVVLCVEAAATDFGKFLQFETLSLFPIDTRLINSTLLITEEKIGSTIINSGCLMNWRRD
jgi:Xaa-Pro aminopeptidase